MVYTQAEGSGPALSFTEAEFIALAEPLYVLGDSHALVFKDLLFYEPRVFKQYFMVKSQYISGLGTSNFSNGELMLHSGLVQAMVSERLLNEKYIPSHLTMTEQVQAEVKATERHRHEPVILFCVGDIDVRSILLKQLGEQVDFMLPFLTEDSTFNQPLSGQVIPGMLVFSIIERLMTPFIQGLNFLKHKLGFKRIFVHSLPPQTLSDEHFNRINKFNSPVPLRYKATLAFNHILHKQCEDQGIGFINLWPHVTQQDQLCEAFHLDHVHLNRRAAQLSIRLLIEQLTTTLNYPIKRHYQLLYDSALREFSAAGIPLLPEVATTFTSTHIYQRLGLIPQEQIETLAKSLNHNNSVGNRHFRLDWAGNTIAPYSEHILSADLDETHLKQIYDIVYAEPVKALIESCMKCHYTVLCCRSFKSLPHHQTGSGPQSFHLDGTPPGIYRLLIYLTDVDENSGPFEYRTPVTQDVQSLTGSAGTVLLFDANQLWHRGQPPLQQERWVLDLVLCPALPSIGNWVLWPGMNNWPIDPFYFSVADYSSWPPLETDTVQISFPEA